MRLAIELDGTRHEVETSQYAETATLADLVEAVCGSRGRGEEPLWVDGRRAHRQRAALRRCCCSRASRVARSPLEPPQPVRGWAALMSGGLDAGRTVAVPAKRPLLIGRSPAGRPDRRLPERLVEPRQGRDAPPRSRAATRPRETSAKKKKQAKDDGEPRREGDGSRGCGHRRRVHQRDLRRRGEGARGGRSSSPTRRVVVVGGTAVTLRRDLAESLAPAPGSLHNVTTAGTAPFNRPPRPGRPPRARRRSVPPVHKDPPAAQPVQHGDRRRAAAAGRSSWSMVMRTAAWP